MYIDPLYITRTTQIVRPTQSHSELPSPTQVMRPSPTQVESPSPSQNTFITPALTILRDMMVSLDFNIFLFQPFLEWNTMYSVHKDFDCLLVLIENQLNWLKVWTTKGMFWKSYKVEQTINPDKLCTVKFIQMPTLLSVMRQRGNKGN